MLKARLKKINQFDFFLLEVITTDSALNLLLCIGLIIMLFFLVYLKLELVEKTVHLHCIINIRVFSTFRKKKKAQW